MSQVSPDGPEVVWPPPWTVETVRERLAHLKRRGLVAWEAELTGEWAGALLKDAIMQGQKSAQIDLGVMDESLRLYLRYKGLWLTPLER